MIRLTGLLALCVSAALILLLLHRTASAEFSGTVSGPPPDPSGFPSSPEFVWILRTTEPTEAQEDVLGRAADRISGRGGTSDGVFIGYYSVRFPAAVTRAASIGDDLVIRESRVDLFGMSFGRLTYRLSGASGTSRFGLPDNARFFLAWGLLAGGPIALWGVAAGISGLRRRL